MATAQTPSPTITNSASIPLTPRKLFVNIPVSDLQRSIIFFEALGFAFNPAFTDAQGSCMLVGEDAYFMLLTHERFAGFSNRPPGDPSTQTTALFSFSVDNRGAVDEVVRKALAAGGSHALDSTDLCFMYSGSFYDPDGHHWEVFWMDPNAIPG